MRLLIFLAGLFWAVSCRDNKPLSTDLGPPVNPPKVLQAAFLVVEGVYNSELIAPMDVLQHTRFHTDKGIEVFTIAAKRDTITTFEGLKIIPDYTFSDSLNIDILVVPSAEHSMDTDLQNEALMAFVKKAGHEASYVMSLCDGAFVLASAGLLQGHECTTFPGDIQKFKSTFPTLTVHEQVSFVHDRKFITSAGGAKSYDPSLYLVELLYGKEVAMKIGQGLVIDWNLALVKHKRTGL